MAARQLHACRPHPLLRRLEIIKQMRALSLSDYQMQQLRAAAKNLLPSQRSDFLEGVAKRLDDAPSDEALQIAIAVQLCNK